MREFNQDVLRFTNIKSAIKLLETSQDRLELIVIDKEEIKNPYLRKLNNLTKQIPRIILYENSEWGSFNV